MMHRRPAPGAPRRLAPSDTEGWADRMQHEHWGRLAPLEKAEILTRLCRAAHQLSLLGLARRHPEASDDELRLRAACQRLGRVTVEQVLGSPLPFPE